MLRHFQPFIDYKKMIETESQTCSYRLTKEQVSKKNPKTKMQNGTKGKVKTLKVGRK